MGLSGRGDGMPGRGTGPFPPAVGPDRSSADLRVVALGAGAGLPATLRGIAEARFPRGWSWSSSGGHDRLASVRPGGRNGAGAPSLGSLVLTSPDDPAGGSRWSVARAGDPSATSTIAAADLIVLGPGGVDADLLPFLLRREIAEAIGRSRARVVLVIGLMTEAWAMNGYTASDCVRSIRRHAPEVPIHDVLLNDAPLRSDQVVRCARAGALPIGYDTEALEALGCRPLVGDLLWDGPVVRHDPRKVGRAILGLVADPGTWTRVRACLRPPGRQGFPPADSVTAG